MSDANGYGNSQQQRSPGTGRSQVLAMLDRLLADEKCQQAIKAALAAEFQEHPLRFFRTVVMPLLPHDVKLSDEGRVVVGWRSLLKCPGRPGSGRQPGREGATMTRVGKIARLPREIREQLNRRLEDGEPGVEALAWLNALPQVQTVLEAEFAGRPISEQNLSEWKLGGYIEWQKHRESLALVRELAANADELAQVAGASLADKASPLMVARYVAILMAISTDTDKAPDDWKVLHGLCGDLVALRKGDHSAERLKLDRERLLIGL